tara:strand:+ start:374 stop:532 length:159 start_codon:yes stop_codon:yes gene_type:complete
MKKYNVIITEYYCIKDIEAESLEEAERIVAEDADWGDDHFQDVDIDAEEVEA